MQTKPKQPITCRICGFSDTCSPCHFGKEIDYKTRTGICKRCAKAADKLEQRANQHSLLGAGKMSTIKSYLQKVAALPGDTAELGVYKGGSALLIAATLPDADCYLFDTFDGMPVADEIDVHKTGEFADTSLEAVKALLADCKNAQFRVGLFPETAKGLESKSFKLVHIDGDQYQTTRDALEFFYPRMVEGGVMLFDDYEWQNCPGVAQAVREFLADKPESLEYPTQFQAALTKGKVANKEVLDIHTTGTGIGDAICALYAACGAAQAGHKVRFHTDKTAWLSRASFPGVEIVQSSTVAGYNVNLNYTQQLRAGADRKQWYCDNLAREAGIESFTPVAPKVDKTIGAKRIDSQRYVLLSPFSAWRNREWPQAHWARLAHQLHEQGYDVIAIDGAGNGRRLKETFSSTPAKWFWGQSPEWVTDAILGAHAVIGNDSGIAHLAGMLGVKTIAIHAQAPPEQLWGHTHIIPVFSQASCAGCCWQGERGYKPGCEKFGCSALAGIGTEDALSALQV